MAGALRPTSKGRTNAKEKVADNWCYRDVAIAAEDRCRCYQVVVLGILCHENTRVVIKIIAMKVKMKD